MQPDMWEASIKCELLVQKKLDYMRRVRVKEKMKSGVMVNEVIRVGTEKEILMRTGGQRKAANDTQ